LIIHSRSLSLSHLLKWEKWTCVMWCKQYWQRVQKKHVSNAFNESSWKARKWVVKTQWKFFVNLNKKNYDFLYLKKQKKSLSCSISQIEFLYCNYVIGESSAVQMIAMILEERDLFNSFYKNNKVQLIK
jgi:hypothetical protein